MKASNCCGVPPTMSAACASVIAERTAAKKVRDFAKADAVLAQLTELGIILEDTKDGIRWKRK